MICLEAQTFSVCAPAYGGVRADLQKKREEFNDREIWWKIILLLLLNSQFNSMSFQSIPFYLKRFSFQLHDKRQILSHNSKEEIKSEETVISILISHTVAHVIFQWRDLSHILSHIVPFLTCVVCEGSSYHWKFP